MDTEINVTKTVYRVVDFLSWQRQGTLDLRPYFQRGSVWRSKAKSYLIDTLLRGYPIPIIFLQDKTNPETLEPLRQVVDGQQRLRTILGFIDISCLQDADDRDDFRISRAHDRRLGGRRFKDLPEEDRDRLVNTELSVHVLPARTPDFQLLEIFARMNSTGTKLNRQELRNASYSGEFKTLCYQLAYQNLDRWLKWRIFNTQQVAQMLEVELTSELIAYMLMGLQAKSQPTLDALYKDYDDEFPQSEEASERLQSVLDKVDTVYGRDLKGQTPGAFKTSGWLYVLFALVYERMFGDPGNLEDSLKPRPFNPARLRDSLIEAVPLIRSDQIDSELAKALRGAATDRGSRQVRLNFLRSLLRSQ